MMPKLPPLPDPFIRLYGQEERVTWARQMNEYALAYGKSVAEACAEIFDKIGNNVQPHPSYCAALIRKVEKEIK